VILLAAGPAVIELIPFPGDSEECGVVPDLVKYTGMAD
jgi:hypothetical protein